MPPKPAPAAAVKAPVAFETEVAEFNEFGTATQVIAIPHRKLGEKVETKGYVNEFWTAKQRAASSLQEISYRACFKPQLPRFFIERLTRPGEVVYDPFMGRGTTLIEAALMGRVPFGCDVNPLSQVLVRGRLNPPTLAQVEQRLAEINLDNPADEPEDLQAFFHPATLRQISSLKHYFVARRAQGTLDPVDDWLCLVALNRLTGHSPGFFSVYTLPPNQATSVVAQRKINAKRNQTPPNRDVRPILLKKSKNLLGDCDAHVRATLAKVAPQARLVTSRSAATPELPDGSVALVVTSPPFMAVVDYAGDNWLRCWFLGIDAKTVKITMARKLEDWAAEMTAVMRELHRVLRPGGHVAFEVGEVAQGSIRLEESVLPCGLAAGLEPRFVLINAQEFTKTANCWGVDNNDKGTNTNRIVVFRKPG